LRPQFSSPAPRRHSVEDHFFFIQKSDFCLIDYFDPQIFPCCLNAVSLALLDTGIQTADMLTAVGAAILSSKPSDADAVNALVPAAHRLQVGSHSIVIDPTRSILSSPLCEGEATFAWDQRERLIVSWYKHNPLLTEKSDSMDESDGKGNASSLFFKCMYAAKEAWKHVCVFKRQAITRKLMFEVNVSTTNAARAKAAEIEAEVEAEDNDAMDE
jgi:hypothetical protein